MTELNSAAVNAIVYCEGQFGKVDGKTANGLVRHSEKYKILAIIDSTKAGSDSGMVLDKKPNDIPIYKSITDALNSVGEKVHCFILGIAPASGKLNPNERQLVLEAIGHKMNIVNGLHEFLNCDSEIKRASVTSKVQLIDIRQPPEKKDLHVFSGKVRDIECPRVAIMGTDCAIGKRTTANILNSALKNQKINSVIVHTGQTGLIQGAKYGIPLDAVPSQFCAGELESVILKAHETERPDIILIEGQGSLSHPAYSTSSFILRGSCPQAVILQHAPGRKFRCDFKNMKMPSLESEIRLIEEFSDTTVVGIAINNENLTPKELKDLVDSYEKQLGLPALNPLNYQMSKFIEILFKQFPNLAMTPLRQI